MVQTQANQISSHGLQSFIDASPDYELAPIGLGSMRDQAEKLAEYGRYGDIYVVHAAEGETVVPMEVLEANPQIKSLLFQQMAEMGLDPGRYVVGNNLNSLNPVTGMPEFFFKKLWKSVKKVLPMVAPIIGNMIAPGIGGLIATGLTTKLSGGSWGDALKATALAWGGQALMGGVSASLSNDPNKGFFSGFMKGARAPIEAGGNLFTGWEGAQLTGPGAGKNPLAQGIGSELFGAGPYDWANKGFVPGYDPSEEIPTFSVDAKRDPLQQSADYDEWYNKLSPENQQRALAQNLAALPGPSPKDLPYADEVRIRQAELYNAEGSRLSNEAAYELAVREVDAATNKGSILGEYSPSKFLGLSEEGSDVIDAGLGLGATYLLGGFDPTEEKQPVPRDFPTNISNQPTAEELLAEDRLLPLGERRFTIGGDLLDPSANIPSLDVQVPTTFPYPMYGAHGGTVNYPRQTGHINGPGTGTSDSIPAMLSNGEFVMTKRAVDGAGGPGTMYDLMRNFEMRT